MQDFQKNFIKLAIEREVLCFGEFTLKSGRLSPYFFNAGKFDSGAALAVLGRAYADAIVSSEIEFDMLFGPAYKGIPLVSATAAALSEHHEMDIPYAFNRKEAKAHGEGGIFVGAEPKGKVLIIDDVITAGTAIREAVELFKQIDSGVHVAGVVIGLNRQEKGSGSLSAVQEVQRDIMAPVLSIVDLDNIIQYLEGSDSPVTSECLEKVKCYRSEYGV